MHSRGWQRLAHQMPTGVYFFVLKLWYCTVKVKLYENYNPTQRSIDAVYDVDCSSSMSPKSD